MQNTRVSAKFSAIYTTFSCVSDYISSIYIDGPGEVPYGIYLVREIHVISGKLDSRAEDDRTRLLIPLQSVLTRAQFFDSLDHSLEVFVTHLSSNLRSALLYAARTREIPRPSAHHATRARAMATYHESNRL
jgi:hypothetical protein